METYAWVRGLRHRFATSRDLISATWRGWSLYLSRSPAWGQQTTCWLQALRLGAGEITAKFRYPSRHPRWHAHADHHLQQRCSAALLQTRPLQDAEKSQRATSPAGKAKDQPPSKPAGIRPDLPAPPLGGRECSGSNHLSLPPFHVHALLQPWEMLCPCSLLGNGPCCSCCCGTTRGHQTSLSTVGEGPSRSPASSFCVWTALGWLCHSPSLEGSASLNHGKKKAFTFRSLQLFLAFLP